MFSYRMNNTAGREAGAEPLKCMTQWLTNPNRQLHCTSSVCLTLSPAEQRGKDADLGKQAFSSVKESKEEKPSVGMLGLKWEK